MSEHWQHEELTYKQLVKLCEESRGGSAGLRMPIWMICFFLFLLGCSIFAVRMS